MTPPKKINKAPINDPKEMEIYKLSDKEFWISNSFFFFFFDK